MGEHVLEKEGFSGKDNFQQLGQETDVRLVKRKWKNAPQDSIVG